MILQISKDLAMTSIMSFWMFYSLCITRDSQLYCEHAISAKHLNEDYMVYSLIAKSNEIKSGIKNSSKIEALNRFKLLSCIPPGLKLGQATQVIRVKWATFCMGSPGRTWIIGSDPSLALAALILIFLLTL